MSAPTTAAGFAASFADYAAKNGADRATLLQTSGLSEDDLADPSMSG